MYRQAKYDEPLIFEMRGECTYFIECENESVLKEIPETLLRNELNIPDNEESEVVRHYVRLSQMNYGVDINMYPLGSCTMKYNPKYSEIMLKKPEIMYTHPLQDESTVQGFLQIMYELQEMLKEIGGMDAVSLQPAAGAHGEFTGMLIVRKYFENLGEDRNEVIVPDSAHGTNPATATMVGYDVVEIPSQDDGTINIEALKSAVSKRTAAFMITNPNTLGIFEPEILKIAKIVHEHGALLYYDGANLNGIMGYTKPGRMGFDIMHFNLHKTFGTPHGGGGPGAGPVGVKKFLEEYLPVPIVRKTEDGRYYLDYSLKNTIGKVRSFYGNFAVLLKAWAYIKQKGCSLKEVTERAVINANYLKCLLEKHYKVVGREPKKHEFVVSGPKRSGIRTMDIAKRILDHGFHAPTVYFPLIVDEAMMIEPTETENKRNLDKFAEMLIKIMEEINEKPEVVSNSPSNTAVRRVDDVLASRKVIASWMMMKHS